MADPSPRKQPRRIIRASEIGQYGYCARAWWLSSVEGVPSANSAEMAQGEAAHRRHGHRAWVAVFLRALAVGLLIIAGAMLLAALLH